jgi:D-lyxose ketol-isomerase
MTSRKIESLISESGIFLTAEEIANLEVTDFGLNDFEAIGLTVHTYLNTDRCCAKELMILPYQTCPEHRHPNTAEVLGKEETFRCRYGKVSIFIEGASTDQPSVQPPVNGEEYYTVFHEVVLARGEQLTLMPETKHWFQAHGDGAVVSEFSTHSNDATDIFTDVRINRFSFV